MFEFTKVFAIPEEQEGEQNITEQSEQIAQTAQNDVIAGQAASETLASIGPLVMMVALFVLMYFILIRPQKKKEKEAQAMINSVCVGDKVVTIGGICGKITKIKDDFIYLESGNPGTADERTILKMERQAIKSIEKKTESKKDKTQEAE